MRKTVFLGFVIGFVLVACSREEPPATPAPEVEVEVTETPADVVVEDPGEETQPELVEESAAEPDEAQDADQPIVLARDTDALEASTAPKEWKFSEGKHYFRLVPTQPTVGGADKIEVAEIFWYGCSHCYNFEPEINSWSERVPANARFVRIPAVWNALARLHGQLYYTEEVLARNGKLADAKAFHAAVFNEYHRKNNRLTTQDAIQNLFVRHGVSKDDFLNVWNSFEVNQKIRVADDLVKRYNVDGVPAVVVNGKYRSAAAAAGSYPKLIEVIDELIERETVR